MDQYRRLGARAAAEGRGKSWQRPVGYGAKDLRALRRAWLRGYDLEKGRPVG